MLTFEYRAIPSESEEVGGDDIYLGSSNPKFEPPLKTWGHKFPAPPDTFPAEESYEKGGRRYQFVGWNVSSTDPSLKYTIDDLHVSIDSTTAAPVTATAWYLEQVPGPPGPPHISCYGIDVSVNRIFRKPPIEAVSPTAAWPGGRVVYTGEATDGVDITAEAAMLIRTYATHAVHIETGAGFTTWRMRGVTSPGALHAKRGAAGVALAYYERFVHGRQLNSIPYWLWLLLHGKLDRETLIGIIKGPLPEPPAVVDHGELVRVLETLDHRAVRMTRDYLRRLVDQGGKALHALDAMGKR